MPRATQLPPYFRTEPGERQDLGEDPPYASRIAQRASLVPRMLLVVVPATTISVLGTGAICRFGD